jgi:hypothetical protein
MCLPEKQGRKADQADQNAQILKAVFPSENYSIKE